MDEEARERGIISATPEVVKPKGGERINWSGKTSPGCSPSFSSSDEKPLPRYLQTSIKSCHDFCKYGRRHDFEGKERHSFLHRSRNNVVIGEEQTEAKALDFGERGKRHVGRLKALPMQRIEFSDKPKSIKHEALSVPKEPGLSGKPVNKELQNLSTGHKSTVSGKQAILPASPENAQIKLKSLNTGGRKERQIIKQKDPLQPKTFVNKPKVLKPKDQSCGNKVDACGKPGIMKEKTVLSSKKGIASIKPALHRQISVKKPVTAAKPVIMKQKASVPPRSISNSAKHEISVKAKKTSVVKSTSPLTPSAGLASRRKWEDNTSKVPGMTMVGEWKVLKPSTDSLPAKPAHNGVSNLQVTKHSNEKLTTPVKGQENVENTAHDSGVNVEKAEHDIAGKEEKTFYVIEPEAETDVLDFTQQISDVHQTLESMSPDEEEDEEPESMSGFSKSSESLFDDVGTESNSSDELSAGEDRRRPRRTATIHPVDNIPAPYRLKFRRGRVIEPRTESNGPRRLTFRRRGMVGENPNGRLVGRRSFRRRNGMDVSNDPNPQPQGVVLRHQDTQGKKETQSLFNNVIEETASKLVETRKSKVKALVGAFETVISLQDRKPASTA